MPKILVQEGETVDVGTKLAVIAPEGATAAPARPEPLRAQAAAEAAAEPRTPPAETPSRRPADAEAAAPAPAAAPPAPAAEDNGKTFVSPVVARIASEHGVDVGQVQGDRPRRPRDEEGHPRLHRVGRPGSRASEPARHPRAGAGRPPPSPRTALRPQPARPAPGETSRADDRDAEGHRRAHAPLARHLRARDERDRGRHVEGRRDPRKLKKEYQASYGVNPTYLAFVARATVETLRDYPWVNGEIRGDQIVTRNYVNLGFAVELADGKGLIVPVVKNAETLNLLGLAKAIADIAQRAREKQLLPDDVQGGTFTITNPGGYGTFHGTPVISQPQAAILGTYAVVKRAWVIQDELGQDVIAIRPIMNLTLTYDHRLVDGALAGRFLRDLRERLESWDESRTTSTGRGPARRPACLDAAPGAGGIRSPEPWRVHPEPRARPVPGGLGAAALARGRGLAGRDPRHGRLPRAPAGRDARAARGRRRAARAGGRRGRDRRDRPRRQVHLPRAGPARLLPDPRPQAARPGRQALLPRPRGGADPHACAAASSRRRGSRA